MALSDLIGQLQQLQQLQTTAGFYDTSHYPDGTPVAQAALTNEFGADHFVEEFHIHVPARPFMRPAIERYKTDWAKVAEEGIKEMARGDLSPMQIHDRIGLSMQGDIKKEITEPGKLPLSPITLALRKQREDGIDVTQADVANTIRAIKIGATLEMSTNTTPLNETGYMIDSVAYEVKEL